MVDLDGCLEADKIEIAEMLLQHVNYTGSSAGKFLLDDLDNQLQHFVKVFPKDYKKVLAQQGNAIKQNA